jgi:hypothetical protein
MKTLKITEEQLKDLLRNAFVSGEEYQADWCNEQVGEVEEITTMDFGEWYKTLNLENYENTI